MDLSSKPIGMSYVPWQMWENIYEPQKALMNGTIFQDLNLPFTGKPVIASSSPRSNCNSSCNGRRVSPYKGGCRNARY